MNKQMTDFDEFTANIAGHDPVKIRELERGTIVTYWRVATDHVTKLVNAKERADKAARKHSIPSRRG